MKHSTAFIIGAGPTGLFAAVLLQKLGLDFRIIDEKPSPTQTSNALAIQSRTLEIFQDIGLIDQVIKTGLHVNNFNIHANSKSLTKINLSNNPTQFPFVIDLPQCETETLLLAELAKHNIQVEREKSLTGLTQTKNEVTLELTTTTGKEAATANWVIGCDGYHSKTREFVGGQYEGKDLKQHFIMMDASMQSILPHDEMHIFFHPNGATIIIPLPTCIRVIAEVSHDPEFKNIKELNHDIFNQIVKRRCHTPMVFSHSTWESSFWVHERIASHYRYKRVFLAGDAAHVHSPAGGQGMNTGLQDVHNLIWKLYLTEKHKTETALLETYHQERYPVARKVLNMSTRLTHIGSLSNPVLTFLRNTIFAFINHLAFIKHKLSTTLTQLNIHYRTKERCCHPLIGQRAALFQPHYRHLLVIFPNTMDAEETITWIKKDYADIIKILQISKDHLSHYAAYQLKAGYCIVRPDQYFGHVANNLETLKEYFLFK